MLKEHFFDNNYQYSSKQLKRFLEKNVASVSNDNLCFDIPCGNGRNTFLLASYFKKVIGVDICEKYLEEIEGYKSKYNIFNVSTVVRDLRNANLAFVYKANFVCISHFYEKTFFYQLKNNLKHGAKMYIETPTCRGGNYLDLPDHFELNQFLNGFKVIFLKTSYCNSGTTDNHRKKGISFTTILEVQHGR